MMVAVLIGAPPGSRKLEMILAMGSAASGVFGSAYGVRTTLPTTTRSATDIQGKNASVLIEPLSHRGWRSSGPIAKRRAIPVQASCHRGHICRAGHLRGLALFLLGSGHLLHSQAW